MPSPQREAKLRVHVQEDLDAPEAHRLTKDRLRAILAAYPDVSENVDFSFGTDRRSLDLGIADAEALLVGSFEADNLGQRAPRLKWVQSIFAGVDKLLPHIPDRVTLTNASGVHAPKAGEFAICAILMLNSAIPRMVEAQKEKRWQPIFTPLVAGKTVVILGTGKMGAATAAQARHFGMRVLGINRSGAAHPGFDEVLPITRLHEALRQAHFIVNILPHTTETERLLGVREFAAVRPGAGFVNIGRGQSVDEPAMVEALRSGQLGAAVLDVFDAEPLPHQSPLWSMPNVMISAHCAVDDPDTYLQRAIDIFSDNVRRHMTGKPLENTIDRKLGY